MKLNLRSLALVASCLTLSLPALPASAQLDRLYVNADLGGEWTLDTHLKEFFGEPLAPNSKVKFDPGVRFGLGVGYLVTDWFAAEMQTGVMANEIKSIGGAGDINDATYSNVPFLINARFQCPSKCPVKPFFGGGLGFSAATIDADHIDIGGTRFEGNDATVVFAYQAFAGLRFRINDHMGVSAIYHYFATTGPEWEADSTFGTGSDRMRFNGTETHAVTVAFEYKF